MDEEIRSLLETLAGGFFQDDACLCCGARLITMAQEAVTNIHVANCPVLRARKQLAREGTPVKLFSITGEMSRFDEEGTIGAIEHRVIRTRLNSEDALLWLSDYLASRYGGSRQLVPGSMRIREIGVVPTEEIAWSASLKRV